MAKIVSGRGHITRHLKLDLPDNIEEYLKNNGYKHIAGVDEAGRGPLAGPVVAAAVVLPDSHIPSGIKDSKKLSSVKRELLYGCICDTCAVGIGVCWPEEIDSLGIATAAKKAMVNAVKTLPVSIDFLIIDGPGYMALPVSVPQKTIIRGDSICKCVSAASIVAKVVRDRIMKACHSIFPAYSFSSNKGYCTAEHLLALKSNGPTDLHRKSFKPVEDIVVENAAHSTNHQIRRATTDHN